MVSVEGQGWKRAPVGLLLRGGVVGGAGCSLLFSETIKRTVISPGRLNVLFYHTFKQVGTFGAVFCEHLYSTNALPTC